MLSWYFLFIIIAITIAIMLSILLYKANLERKDRRKSQLQSKWRSYLDTIMEKGHSGNSQMMLSDIKELQSVEDLMAFYAEAVLIKEDKIFRTFLHYNKDFWVQLGRAYEKKRAIEKAYFAYVCEQLRLNEPDEYNELTELMLSYIMAPSVYCRENALKALYAFGNIDGVVDGLLTLTRNHAVHHRKLVSDGLMEFKGNQKELAEALYERFEQFDKEYQIAIIDFFRLSRECLKHRLITLLEKKCTDKDVACALLRYYRKYPVPEYKEIILAYLYPENEEDWEYTSTAASVLGQYPGKDTVQALKSVLSSKYWYVRLNAARSIAELGVEESQVRDILDGQDFYAKDQLSYQLANRQEERDQYGYN